MAWLTLGPGAWGYTHAQLGTVVEDAEMPTLAGGTDHLFTHATANVFIFFRPGQEFSRLALKELAAVQKQLAGKSIHWVGIVSDRAAKEDVQAMVKESGISMPVLIDVGDVFYGKLGVAQVPVTVLFDQQHKLVAYQSVHQGQLRRRGHRPRALSVEGDQRRGTGGGAEPAGRPHRQRRGAAQRRLKLATMLFQAKSYPKALENVDVSIAENPSAAAYALRGDILAAQGNCPEAVSAYGQALKLDPQNARALQGMKGCPEKKP